MMDTSGIDAVARPRAAIEPLAPEATRHMDVGPLGQMAGFDVYTQLTYVFAGGDDSQASRAATVAKLAAGLQRLGATFPWLAGAVVRADEAEQRFCFAPRPIAGAETGVAVMATAPELVVRDLTSDAGDTAADKATATNTGRTLTIATLAAAGYPYRLLDEGVVAPVRTLPGGGGGATHETACEAARPVLVVQATFVAGGLLLTAATHHRALDMGGMAFVLRQLAAACRGDAIDDDVCALGNCARTPLVPLLASDEPGGVDPVALIPDQVVGDGDADGGDVIEPLDEAQHDAVMCDENTDADTDADGSTPVWSYFAFGAAQLTALKAAALASRPAEAPAPFVSTNDACTAWVWQAVVRARLPRLGWPPGPSQSDLETQSGPETGSVSADRFPLSTLARAVDVRRALGLPAGTPGLLQTMTLHTRSAAWVATAPLGAVAAMLRAALLDPAVLVRRTRALAMATVRHMRSNTHVAITGRAGADAAGASLMLGSWTDVPADAARVLDLGLAYGMPRAVCRPAFTPLEGLGYLLPRATDGTVVAMLCLRTADLARLRADAVFAQYARYVG